MSGVKRYTAYDALMQVESNGKFVLASDYDRDTQALKAEIERYIQDGIKLADQRDALAADNQLMRDLLRQLWYVSSNGWKTKIDAALAGSKEGE